MELRLMISKITQLFGRRISSIKPTKSFDVDDDISWFTRPPAQQMLQLGIAIGLSR